MRTKRLVSLSLSLSLTVLLPACDGGSDAADDKARAAADAKAQAEKEQEEALARRKAEREAKEAAKEEEARKKEEAIAALAVLPDKLPKKLDAACKDVAAAQDELMNKHYDEETAKKWNSAKGTQLPMTIAQCTKSGSIEVAACQANGLRNAPKEQRKAIPDIFRICHEKFGQKAE